MRSLSKLTFFLFKSNQAATFKKKIIHKTKVKMFPHIFLLLLTGRSEKCECSAFRFDFQFILLSKLDGFLCFLSVGSSIIFALKYPTAAITLLL